MRLFVFLLVLASASLGASEPASAQSPFQVPPAPKVSQAPQTPQAPQDAGPSYVLQYGDSVEVTYTYTPEYNQTVIIPSDGSVGLPRVGSVHIVGLSLRAATAAIASAASRSGLNKPEVVLTLRDYVKPQFTVLGQVGRPGRYELHGTLRVADGLAVAGGPNLNARLKYIILIHPISDTEGETTLYDFKALEKKHSSVTFDTLQDGDIIVVPQGNISKIERFVRLANVGAYYPF